MENSETNILCFYNNFSVDLDMHKSSSDLYSICVKKVFSGEISENEKKDFILFVSDKLPDLFSTVIKGIKPFINGNRADKELNFMHLKSACLCLDSLSLLVQNSSRAAELQCVLQCALKIQQEAYCHCRDSEQLYGELFEDFNEPLADLFKRIQNVQTVLYSAFERLFSVPLDNIDSRTIVNIGQELSQLCEIVSTLEPLIGIKLWRVFAKLLTQHSDALKELDMNPPLLFLTSNIIQFVNDSKSHCDNNEKMDESELKISIFQINLIMKIYNCFHAHLSSSFQQLTLLVLNLYFPSLLCCTVTVEIIEHSLSNLIRPMVTHFMSDVEFIKSGFEIKESDVEQYLHPALFILKLDLLLYYKTKEENDSYRCTEDLFKEIVLCAIGSTVDSKTLLSTKLPTFLCHENKEFKVSKSLSLYQHTSYCLKKHLKSIPDSEFDNLVAPLLEKLNSSPDVVSLLISDVCVYRFRCCSLDKLLMYSSEIARCCSKDGLHLKVLLERVLKYLPEDMKNCVLQKNKECSPLLTCHAGVNHIYGIPRLSKSTIFSMDADDIICTLVKDLDYASSNIDDMVQKALGILEWFAVTAGISSNAELLKFLKCSMKLFSTGIFDVQIAVLTFLKVLGCKNFMNDPNIERVIQALVDLLILTLSCSNVVVRHEALSLVGSMAKSNFNQRVIRVVLSQAPHLAPLVKSYFLAVPLESLSEEQRALCLEKVSHVQDTNLVPAISGDSKEILMCLSKDIKHFS